MRTYKNLVICTAEELIEKGKAFKLLEKTEKEVGIIVVENDGRRIRMFTMEKMIERIEYWKNIDYSEETTNTIFIFPHFKMASDVDNVNIWSFKHLLKYYIAMVEYKRFYKGIYGDPTYLDSDLEAKMSMLCSAIIHCHNLMADHPFGARKISELIEDQRCKQEEYEKSGMRLNKYLDFFTT